MVRIGSLYAGIAGLELGLMAAFAESGIPSEIAWQCEIDPFCSRVLAHHFPDVQRFGDVATVSHPPVVDVLAFGFSCQDVSSAGRGEGLAKTTRSGFTLHHALRIASEIRPAYLVIENVASGAKRWLPTVVQELRDRGYRPRAVPLGAVDVGAPHRRLRVFVVADRDDQRQQGERRGGLLDGVGKALGHDAHGRGNGGERQGMADAASGGRQAGSGEPAGAGQARIGRASAGRGGALSDALGGELRQQPGRSGGTNRAGARGAAVADGEREGLEVECEQQARRQQQAPERGGEAGGAAELGDTAESRRARANGCGGSPGERRSSLLAERSGAAAASDGRTPQSGVGSAARGLPFDVAGCAFPAGRGEAQHDWEAPRAVPKEVAVPERPAKLRATGNCVVPQCSLVVGRVLIDVMRGRR